MDITVLPSGSDDSPALNAAIAQLGGQPGLVQMENGLYRFGSQLLTDHGLTLSGRGENTVLQPLPGLDASLIGNLGGYSTWRNNVTLANFRIDGDKENQAGGHGILRSGTGAVYKNLWLENCWGRGLSHNGGDGAKVQGCAAAYCNRHGFHVEKSANAEISDCEARECGTIVGINENRAIHGYQASNLKILRAKVYGGGGVEQIGAWACPDAVISDCELRDGINMGIAPFSARARILRNKIINAGNNAIDTRGESYCQVEENIIDHVMRNPLGGGTNSDVENSGICVNGSYNKVRRNAIAYCGRCGIQVVFHAGNEVLENAISNCGQQGAGQAGIWVQLWDAAQVNDGTIIRGNRCYDDQAAKTQEYGVLLDAPAGTIRNIIVRQNDLRGNALGAIGNWYPANVVNADLQAVDYEAAPAGTPPGSGSGSVVFWPFLVGGILLAIALLDRRK
jgi:hypothetical protein